MIADCAVTLAELCSKIALKIDRSAMLSNRVCHACGRKIHNAFQLYNFIYLNLETEKETAVIEVAGDSGRFKQLLPTTVSLPDRSPQARKGLKISGESTAVKKSLSFNEVPSSANDDNNPTLKPQDEISPQEVGKIAFSQLNVEDLLESTTTEVKVVIVNPSGCVETYSSFQDKMKSMIACKSLQKEIENCCESGICTPECARRTSGSSEKNCGQGIPWIL